MDPEVENEGEKSRDRKGLTTPSQVKGGELHHKGVGFHEGVSLDKDSPTIKVTNGCPAMSSTQSELRRTYFRRRD
jgi:hypothetical protein